MDKDKDSAPPSGTGTSGYESLQTVIPSGGVSTASVTDEPAAQERVLPFAVTPSQLQERLRLIQPESNITLDAVSEKSDTQQAIRRSPPTAEEAQKVIENELLIKQLEAITQRFSSILSDDDDDVIGLLDNVPQRMEQDARIGLESATDALDQASNMQTEFLQGRAADRPRLSYSKSREREDSGVGVDEEEPQLTVLDPNHPLMQRFQAAYRAHLEKQQEKLTLEIKTLQDSLKHRHKDHESKGELLYGIQQELGKAQSHLEKYHAECHSLAEQRMSLQEALLATREEHKEMTHMLNALQKKVIELGAEVSRWDLVVYLITQMKESMKTDVGVVRCAAEKAGGDLVTLQEEKQRQDVVVKKKMEEVIRLEEMLELYKAHSTSQDDELTEARLTLAESDMQIECLELEKKQIFQQWNNTLKQLVQKDDLIKTLHETLKEMLSEAVNEEMNVKKLTIETNKEMQHNEALTLNRQNTERLTTKVKKEIYGVKNKIANLQTKYSEKARILHQSEEVLAAAIKEQNAAMKTEEYTKRQLDVIIKQRTEKEDQVVEKMLMYASTQKAAEYRRKMTKKVEEKIGHSEGNLVRLENELSRIILNQTQAQVHCERQQSFLDAFMKEVEELNTTSKGFDNQIRQNNLTITKKQMSINRLSDHLENLIRCAGGNETGMIEYELHSLEKQIETKNAELQGLKSSWLKHQTQLVQLSQQRDKFGESCIQLSRRYYIVQNKKRRMDGNIESEEKEIKRLDMNIKKRRTDIGRLNERICSEKGTKDTLAKETVLTENDLINTLKDAELESIQLQGKLDSVAEEKFRLEKSLVEAQEHILMWEKKLQLAKEAKNLVASQEMSGEIQIMRWEIHRMQVRYNQLRRQQEVLIQETEKLISRRESILYKNEAQSKTNRKTLLKSSVQKLTEEMKKNLKQTLKEVHTIQKETTGLSEKQKELDVQHATLLKSVHGLQEQVGGLENSIRHTERHYQRNFQHLVGLQDRVKYLQAIKDKKYKLVSKSETTIEEELRKSRTIAQTLDQILNAVAAKFPRAGEDLLDFVARHEGRMLAASP